jgi:asparagine synthetase B (glutamine-hydrolysing)
MDFLMTRKRSPLHAVEAALYKASLQAARDGVDALIVGNGADSTFGGMDKLLSRDWTYQEFINRYTFIKPEQVLCNPCSVDEIYEPYRYGEGVDVLQFLKTIHGKGIMQAFDNAIHAGGCDIVEPYEQLSLSTELDIPRIRSGESKYLLRALFRSLYPKLKLPEKIPFARPMDEWLKNWGGPKRPEFLPNLPMSQFSGDQKYLLYTLERFMKLIA